ncbi:hypothetical protein TcG_12056, partial [Trypanosoma cruzi]
GQKYPSMMRVSRAMPHLQAVEVLGTGHGAIASPPWCNALWTHPTRKDCMVCWDAPDSAPCAQERLMAAWHGLLWCAFEEFCCFFKFWYRPMVYWYFLIWWENCVFEEVVAGVQRRCE